MNTLIFKISLPEDDAGNACWREVETTADKPLSKLAEGIINAFGFDFDHAYGFYSDLSYDYYSSQVKYELFADMGEDMTMDGPPALSVEKTKTGRVFTELGQKMQFVFDYGDEWRFLIELRNFGEKVPCRRYPRTVNAQGDAPVQYPDWEEDEAEYEDGEVIGVNPQTGQVVRFEKRQKD